MPVHRMQIHRAPIEVGARSASQTLQLKLVTALHPNVFVRQRPYGVWLLFSHDQGALFVACRDVCELLQLMDRQLWWSGPPGVH